jgi:UDP-glucuronate 4-epimerase
MAVLVTGGAGFIGSHLIERLLATDTSEKVVCLDDFNNFYDPALKRANAARFAADPRVGVVEQSFCDLAATRRVLVEHDVRRIVHLGAYGGVRASIENPLIYEESNVRGTLALLEATRGRPIERFLLASSSSVYGAGATVPFREEAPLGAPMSPYAASKRAAELWVATWRQLYALPSVILRLFSVYGPRVRPDLAMHVFANAIVSGRPIPLYGDGSVRRDFTHVSDICDGLLAALDSEHAAGETINLGHNQPASMLELIALLEAALGRKATVERRAAAAADAPLTGADLSKAERLLGYRPKIALADGVRDFARWFLAQA